MSNSPSKQTCRLSPQPAEVIDRGEQFSFVFDGKTYNAHPGDTIASALAAAGVQVLSRSFKYHRRRGLLCCSGHCPNCLVQIGAQPNVRACQRQVQPGMTVEPQNVWPSLDRDVLSLTQWGDRFMPVGFYYKTFIRPQKLWPLYEGVLRRAAGLGKVDQSAPRGAYDKQYLHADVAVVGGGPAGISAALAAAEQGARVQLFDENSNAGGHLRFATPQDGDDTPLPSLVQALEASSVELFSDTAVLGWYEDNWLAAARGNRLFKLRAKAVVVATGAYETPLLFDNNDLPGVLLGSAVQRLIQLYGVVPGQRAVVVTANDDGWQVADALHRVGVTLAAVVDERSTETCTSPLRDELTSASVPVYYEQTIVAARGRRAVSAAVIGSPENSPPTTVPCDLIAVSNGWTPALDLIHMAGGRATYQEEKGEFRVDTLPDGFAIAGRAAGTHAVANQIDEGRVAGLTAAAAAGFGTPPEEGIVADLAARKTAESRRTSDRVCVPGRGKRFLCYCEDVTDVDLSMAVAEGYQSMELLKRYSTTSMGPCQGKMCSMNAIHLCARANGWGVQETGKTTSRPPLARVTLGALTGQNMEPVQVTPVHDWHLEHGASMMVAGLWLRPERYGDPVAEVRAVRERVGLIDVTTLGKLELTGPGVPDLLERLYVNRWRKLAVGRVRYGIMCNEEGVVMDDGVCAHLSDQHWYMSTTTSGADVIYEWIQWWLQSSSWGDGVHVTNVSEAYAAFNLSGPRARVVLRKLTESDLDNDAFPYMGVRTAEVAGVPCRLLRIGFTGDLSFELHCPTAYALPLWQALLEAGASEGIAPFGVEAQRILRLEKGHIIVGQDTDALSDPLSADLAWAVKLNKSDFLGKRSLTRIAERGIENRLVGFKTVQPDLVPEEGLQIVEPNGAEGHRIIGWITSCRYSPTLSETIGLCWLPAALADQEGASFTIYRDGKLEPARVHHGAFFDIDGGRLRQ